MQTSPVIYVDADACPVKEEVIKVATRHGLTVQMVSNSGMRPRPEPNIHSVMVGQGFDAADDWIAERCGEADIVVTADIQLAARCLENGAAVLGPSGKPFTKENIGSALAMREFTAYLRETGEISGRNASFTNADRSRFLGALEGLVRDLK